MKNPRTWLRESVKARSQRIAASLATYRGRFITAALAVYLVISALAGSCAAIATSGRRQPRFEARTALPLNHRITDKDLVVPREIAGTSRELVLPDRSALIGRHLRHDVVQGMPIRPEDVSTDPTLIGDAHRVIVAVPLAKGLVRGAIDAGTFADVVAEGQRIARHAEVVAVTCEADCLAHVDVSPAVAALITGSKSNPSAIPSPARESETAMNEISWIEVEKVDVKVNPGGIWARVLDYVPPGTTLKLECAGEWTYGYSNGKALRVTPDGDLRASAEQGALVADAPAGAVVAKIGGSTAGKTDGERFAVGSSAVISSATDKRGGPLYIAMNVNPAVRPETNETITVRIFEPKP